MMNIHKLEVNQRVKIKLKDGRIRKATVEWVRYDLKLVWCRVGNNTWWRPPEDLFPDEAEEGSKT